MDKFIPTKILKGRRSVPWFSYKLRRMTRRKARLYKHAKKSKQWTEFKSFQRQCKKAFKEAEVNHINDVINEGLQNKNSKPFWKYVKSRKQDNIGISPLKKLGSLFSESKEKAQILVEQFRSVFTIEDSLDMPHMEKQYRHKLPDLTIKTEGVEKLLKNIVTSKACGPDNIPNIILKNCAVQLAPGLRTKFQLSVDSGTLPKDWLNANVSPVFKKGDVHMAENYRPVSLTSVSCKLLEHIICKHLLDHLEKNKILTNLNHGFRAGYSCETQLLTTMHDLLRNNDKGLQTDMVILDFSKAFDTVPHGKLLHKLEKYGINGNLHSWLEMFLTKRHGCKSKRPLVKTPPSQNVPELVKTSPNTKKRLVKTSP